MHCTYTKLIHIQKHMTGCPRGVMVKALDRGIIVSEFEFQSLYYIHFSIMFTVN